jgi:PAS domain S-box-containing protein
MMSRWLRFSIIFGSAFGALALIGLTISLSEPRFFDRYFPALLVINGAVALVLLVIVAAMVFRLWRRYRARQYGSRMAAKMALVTALIAVIPTAAVYGISAAFLSRSYDASANARVEAALDAGVSVTQEALARQQKATQELSESFARSLEGTPNSQMLRALMKLLEDQPGTEALVMTGNGAAVAAAGSKINVLVPDLPSLMQLKTAQTAGIYSTVDGDPLQVSKDGGGTSSSNLRVRVIVPIPSLHAAAPMQGLLPSEDSQPLYLQLTQPVEETVAQHAAKLVDGYLEYQRIAYSRSSMLKLYVLTLTLALLLALFSSIVASLSFAKRTIAPVLQLEKGTKRVATGDFMPIKEFRGSNEINVLTRSFNAMIKDVSETRRSLESQRFQAEQAQAFLERVLSNISSGVVVIDRWFTVVSANEAAQRIMGEMPTAVGSSLRTTLPELAAALEERLHQASETAANSPLEFELHKGEESVPLYIRSTPMALGAQTGFVLVFDDVTQMIKAQKATAWGEVARRLAHEIKNPLTPIRLAAERLEWKLSGKLTDEKDLAMLHKTIATIVTQVDALKMMVNDFREYAKLPEAQLRPMSLNAFLVEETGLYRDAGQKVELSLSDDIPPIDADPRQLRQVLHNLVSNSVEAGVEGKPVVVSIRTEPLHSKYHAEETSAVKLTVEDNGSGFSDKILRSAFEPYITTKPTGSGLGLPMVKKILDEHGAEITLSNAADPATGAVTGARVEIVFKASRARRAGTPEQLTD